MCDDNKRQLQQCYSLLLLSRCFSYTSRPVQYRIRKSTTINWWCVYVFVRKYYRPEPATNEEEEEEDKIEKRKTIADWNVNTIRLLLFYWICQLNSFCYSLDSRRVFTFNAERILSHDNTKKRDENRHVVVVVIVESFEWQIELSLFSAHAIYRFIALQENKNSKFVFRRRRRLSVVPSFNRSFVRSFFCFSYYYSDGTSSPFNDASPLFSAHRSSFCLFTFNQRSFKHTMWIIDKTLTIYTND